VLLVYCGHKEYWVPRHLGGPGRTHAVLHTASAHGQHINARGQGSQGFGQVGFHILFSSAAGWPLHDSMVGSTGQL